jgi:protein-S-isoprenylcysteine O-methyltransferase Ste14
VQTLARALLLASWVGFFYPFVFRAPHWQKRPSIVAAAASRIGMLLEAAGFVLAFGCRLESPPAPARLVAAMVLGPLAAVLAWTAVTHLGRQFRMQAGLWEDHELVRTGPYALVRHPIFLALLMLLAATLLTWTRWPWWPASLALCLAGTEIRVRTEDRLLAGRFGAAFTAYRNAVRAYIPGVR